MIIQEIEELISMKQEGPYWDFKREWYTNNGDLLHDIICIANNLENRESYIVIGIDEEENFIPMDITNIDGLIKDAFKKEYVDVQILKRMLEQFKGRN